MLCRKSSSPLTILGVGLAEDDWRRAGQENFLSDLAFARGTYQAYSGNWDHDHCEFCFVKFVDPNYAEWMREKLDAGSPDHVGAGYTNLRHKDTPSGRYWICEGCFSDFQPEFHWPVVESDPDEWPYDTPEPHPRPTAADFDPDAASRGP